MLVIVVNFAVINELDSITINELDKIAMGLSAINNNDAKDGLC